MDNTKVNFVIYCTFTLSKVLLYNGIKQLRIENNRPTASTNQPKVQVEEAGMWQSRQIKKHQHKEQNQFKNTSESLYLAVPSISRCY